MRNESDHLRLKFPAIRSDVIGALKDLGDPEYQARYWVRHEQPDDGSLMGIEYILDTLFNNYRLEHDPEGWIGTIYYDRQELEAVQKALSILRAFFDTAGWYEEEEVYINHPQWEFVTRECRKAANLLLKNEPPNKSD